MSVLPVGFGSALGGYQIERSLRFNSADSAYLNRTPSSGGNRQKFTMSVWAKRGLLSGDQNFINVHSSVSGADGIRVDGPFVFYLTDASNAAIVTTAVFRDPSAWYHFVCAVDTTQATASNRVRMYVNGVEQTSFSTANYPSQNFNTSFNEVSRAHSIGRNQPYNNEFFNGYLTEFNWVDGQQLTPSSFGETDSNTGVWKPKAFSGTYGTNGFFLKFADNSGTTSTTLGKDSSGNANNWTPNNFSVTAGAGNDSLVDTPTAYGTDTGAGGTVRGNYCTWNPLRPNAAMSYTNGNLDATSNGGSGRSGYGTFGMSSGKWYFETTGGDNSVGIANISESVSATYSAAGSYNLNGTTVSGKATYTTTDLIGCAYDATNGTIEFFKNGVSQGSSSFSAGLGLDMVAQFNGTFSATRTCVANFGQRAFAYTAPSGFKALCTQNLPPVTIGATSTTQANDYFNTVLYTGDYTTSHPITGVGFQPDLVWIKDRGLATVYNYSHLLYDAVRGVGKELRSNATDAEADRGTGTTSPFRSFDSDGFTVGQNYSSNEVDPTAEAFVAWNWNAGGSNATNTSGTITSTVRANTTSGFSIVTYTGTGANATVGHGLGVAPSMIILKGRTNADQWFIWHNTFTSSQYIYFNTTAIVSGANPWNSTLPTSTLFSLGTDAGVNGNTTTYVAYCFAPVAGYSAFGSYTGNGSTDGTFVYTGFRPRYIMLKRSSSASVTYGWQLYDTARSPYNTTYLPGLWADASAAENANTYAIDILSNGFKLRDNNVNNNDSGSTYIYAAFAESPFKFSLAR